MTTDFCPLDAAGVRPLRKLIVTKLPYKGQKFLAAALEEEKKDHRDPYVAGNVASENS